MILDIGLIVGGVVVIGASRVFADAFAAPGDSSGVTRFLGLGDDVASRYYRGSIAVLIGLGAVGIGVARLFS